MRKPFDFGKSGLFALGYVGDESTYLSDLSSMLRPNTTVSETELARNIKAAYEDQKELNYYYDDNGDLQQRIFDMRTCRYAIETGFLAPNANRAYPDEKIFAVFTKDLYGNWSFVRFLTKYRIEKTYNAYRFGNISFRNYTEANKFIIDLEANLLPGETWKFRARAIDGYRPKTQYDVLQSYIRHVFEKLLGDYNDPDSKNHNKIVFSRDGKYALFNSGLLDKYAQDVYLLGEVFGNTGGRFTFSNPRVAGGKVDLIGKYNFAAGSLAPYPDVVEFFDDLDDIIYDSNVEIDLNFDNVRHIIEDGAKRNRFTRKYIALYEKGDLPAITSTLGAAIANAQKIAKRNYKYVVPQYRSARRGEPGKIQFLMPIYLDSQYGERPDFALVLDVVILGDSRFYTPETILELPWAYNNARVICKPEDTWLNPATIDSPLVDPDTPE